MIRSIACRIHSVVVRTAVLAIVGTLGGPFTCVLGAAFGGGDASVGFGLMGERALHAQTPDARDPMGQRGLGAGGRLRQWQDGTGP